MVVVVKMLHLSMLLIVFVMLSCVSEKGVVEMSEKSLVVKTAFENGSRIPEKYTCDGIDVSPPLRLGEVDENAKSLVVIVDDPDAPMGVFTHWIAWNIAPVKEIPEGMPKEKIVSSPVKMIQGVNDFGRIGYNGPCPPRGKPHRYYFKVYALDTVLSLEPGAGKKELEKAMEGHVIQFGEVMGMYWR